MAHIQGHFYSETWHISWRSVDTIFVYIDVMDRRTGALFSGDNFTLLEFFPLLTAASGYRGTESENNHINAVIAYAQKVHPEVPKFWIPDHK